MAVKQRMLKARKPPNLRTGTARARCGLCKHFNGKGICRLYNATVRENDVSDSFTAMLPTRR